MEIVSSESAVFRILGALREVTDRVDSREICSMDQLDDHIEVVLQMIDTEPAFDREAKDAFIELATRVKVTGILELSLRLLA